MSKATLDIKRWDNSLGVRLPIAVAHAANLKVGQRVRMTVEYGKVIVEPVHSKQMSLAERLAKYDIAKHGGEVMTTEPLGAEKW